MSQYLWSLGDLITADRLNRNSYNLFKGVAGYEDSVILADNVAGTLTLKPTIDPVATTQLIQVQNAAGVVQFSVQANGVINTLGGIAGIAFTGLTLAGTTTFTGRILGTQGSDVNSANDLTLGVGNAFRVLNSVQINRIDTTGWQNGSTVTIDCHDGFTVKNFIAAGAPFAPILLAGGVDFVMTPLATLTLCLIAGNWMEIGRKT